jgi:flagellar hook protein FlgE
MSFNIALSGLNVALADLSVTGNNIANASTVGFKESRAEFADVYAIGYQGISGSATGNGVRLANVAQQHTQGNLEFTSNSLDMAVSGQGFFVLRNPNVASTAEGVALGEGEVLYSRAGAFGVNDEGVVVNSMGHELQVYPFEEETGMFQKAEPVSLILDDSLDNPLATSEVDVKLNLTAATSRTYQPYDPAATPPLFSNTDPTTYNFSTSLTVYDSLGAQHIATKYYRKLEQDEANGIGGNTWETFLFIRDDSGEMIPVDGEKAQAGTVATLGDPLADPPVLPLAGDPDRLTFDESGQLIGVNIDLETETRARRTYIDYGEFNPGTDASIMGGDAATRDTKLRFDYDGTTQFNTDFSVQSLQQDGYGSGNMAGIDVDQYGVVYARYSNGKSRELGQVVLANCRNPQGLKQVGDTNWVVSTESGDMVNRSAGVGEMGLVQSGALESSNIELTEQLVKMITAQRNFQANSQMLSTEDQVTQTMLNLR